MIEKIIESKFDENVYDSCKFGNGNIKDDDSQKTTALAVGS